MGRSTVAALLAACVGVRAVLLAAAVLIGGALWWSLHQGYNVILSYADAPTHLNLARRVHDDLHPGLGQLGAYWLPLAHVVELPFVWNDALWRSGLAGAIPSMACYLLSVWCLYKLIELATGQRVPAVIGALAFAANPNVLYLHVSPMFEPTIIASMLGATYLLARWLHDGGLLRLGAAAAAVSLACTSRYEVWGFAIASAVVVSMGLWQQGARGARLRGRLFYYLILAWYAMALWLLWNLALNGSATYFLHPSFNKGLGEARLAVLTYRQPLAAAAYVSLAIADNAGPLLVGLAGLGLWRFATAYGLRARGLWLYLLATPAAFDIFYLWYKGTPPILVPQLIPHDSGNIRYGVVVLPLLCLLTGYLAGRPPLPRPTTPARATLRWLMVRLWPLAQLALLAVALAQPVLLVRNRFVVSYNEPNTAKYRASQDVRVTVAHWLGAHYDRGLILMSTFKGADRIVLDSGLPNRVFVHEGSQGTWRCALASPQRWVSWVVLSHRGDGAAKHLTSASVFGQRYFTLVYPLTKSWEYRVYRRNARPWLAPHHGACG